MAGGASHVGLVFYPPSPRFVTSDQAAGLAERSGPGVAKVGLFVDADDDTFDTVVSRVDLDLLQLHGDETVARVADIRHRFGLKVMKVIKVAGAGDVESAEAYVDVVDWLLFDARVPNADALPGGNAVSFDWRLLGGHRWTRPWMLSGGLDAANVGEAARISGAAFVDVSSGVERVRGRKDADKISAFLAAVRAL